MSLKRGGTFWKAWRSHGQGRTRPYDHHIEEASQESQENNNKKTESKKRKASALTTKEKKRAKKPKLDHAGTMDNTAAEGEEHMFGQGSTPKKASKTGSGTTPNSHLAQSTPNNNNHFIHHQTLEQSLSLERNDKGPGHYHLGLGSVDIWFAKHKEFMAWRRAAELHPDCNWKFIDHGNTHNYRTYEAIADHLLFPIQIIVPEGQGPTLISYAITLMYCYRKSRGRLPRAIILVGTSGSTLPVGTVFCVDKAFNGDSGLIAENGELRADITSSESHNASLFQQGWRAKEGVALVNTFSTASVRENLGTLIDRIRSKNLNSVDMESYSFNYCLSNLGLDGYNYGILRVVSDSSSSMKDEEQEETYQESLTGLYKKTLSYLEYLYKSGNQTSFTTSFFNLSAAKPLTVPKPDVPYSKFNFVVNNGKDKFYEGGYPLCPGTVVMIGNDQLTVKKVTSHSVQFQANVDMRIQVMFFEVPRYAA